MKVHWKNILFLFILTASTAVMYGQYAGATIKPEKNSILIGDQVNIELTLTAPSGSRVQWPLLTDTLAQGIEILRKTGIDTVSTDKDKFTLKQNITVTSFDSGSYVIRPIIFKYSQKGDTTNYFTATLPVSIDVQTIQTDQNADIKPIKPPLKAPVTFREMLPWIGLVLILLALAALIYYYLKTKKQVNPVTTSRLNASIPPYEAAIEALESLRHKKLWQSGRVKDYYSEMTDIVREYIELRYPVRAMEMTTAEIQAALRQTDINMPAREKLMNVLTLADLVKFAKEQPLPLENDRSLNECMEFVRETKPGRDVETATVGQSVIVEQNKTK
jgi:hypothetical protein